jgi:hypothetical protein
MSDALRDEGRRFAEFIGQISAEERDKTNASQAEKVRAEHAKFVEHFERGDCYVCERPLRSFFKATPCVHWLLRPKGFKKKDIEVVAQNFGYFQIQSFLRWVANQEGFARHINDLVAEGTGTKMFEVTIRYKDLEWSFSCAESDYFGHAKSQSARHPHYHFQMRDERRPFIDYNDFHLPFSKIDVINIEAMRTRPDIIKHGFQHGEGMRDVLRDETLEYIVEGSLGGRDLEVEGTFKLDTLLFADEGTKISGEDIWRAIEEARRDKVPIASRLKNIPNTSAKIMVTPGPGVVEQAPRAGGRKGD